MKKKESNKHTRSHTHREREKNDDFVISSILEIQVKRITMKTRN